MENSIQIRYRNQIYELEPGLTLLEALEKLDIDPESVLAIREGEMIGGSYRLKAGDEVRLVAVISGGAITPLGEGKNSKGLLTGKKLWMYSGMQMWRTYKAPIKNAST